MSNETVTEEMDREWLKFNGDYYSECEHVSITKNGKIKRPDFLLTNGNTKLVIECKKDISKHDKGIEQLKGYMLMLENTHNIFGIAVSGNKECFTISSFLKEINENRIGYIDIGKVLSINDYEKILDKQNSIRPIEKEIRDKAKELHEHMRNYGGLRSGQKASLVSAILLALSIKSFRNSYSICDNEGNLPKDLLTALEKELEGEKGLQIDKRNNVLNSYSFIKTEITLNTIIIIDNEQQSPLKFFINFIDKKLLNNLSNTSVDLLGLFYSEFFSYSSKDGNELGIILTPKHITELMLRLVGLKSTDTVLDTCAGTGGFLTTAMHEMLKMSKTSDERTRIKKDGLIGVELDSLMYSMAFANMKFRGDGKANLILGSSLENNIINQYKNRAEIAVINPPYSMAKKCGQEKLHEFNFALTTLNALTQRGKFAIIAPISCFIGKDKLTVSYRKRLLAKHTLNTVISMPDQLFYPTGTVTAIGVFEAHIPHTKTKKTWFYSFKDDGFEITRKGRIDTNSTWENTKESLLEMFENRKTVEGKSISRHVGATDEWVAEAYIETNYSEISEKMFINNMKELHAYEYLQTY